MNGKGVAFGFLAALGCARTTLPPPHPVRVAPAVAISPDPSSQAVAKAPRVPGVRERGAWSSAPLIDFDDLAPVGPRGDAPSAKLAAAAGHPVRMIGFMARMEIPPAGGGFYLTRRQVDCDEAGGGSADLPPDAVRVVGPVAAATASSGSPAAAAPAAPAAPPVAYVHVPGRIEVEGTLDLGAREEPDGTVSRVRIVLGERGGS
jgi:hypothetical protein